MPCDLIHLGDDVGDLRLQRLLISFGRQGAEDIDEVDAEVAVDDLRQDPLHGAHAEPTRLVGQLHGDLLPQPRKRGAHCAKLSLFFRGIAPALAWLRERIPVQLANEARRLCMGTLERVLSKIVYRNPGINLVNVLRTLPPEADQEELKAQVAHIVAKVGKITRREGDRVD